MSAMCRILVRTIFAWLRKKARNQGHFRSPTRRYCQYSSLRLGPQSASASACRGGSRRVFKAGGWHRFSLLNVSMPMAIRSMPMWRSSKRIEKDSFVSSVTGCDPHLRSSGFIALRMAECSTSLKGRWPHAGGVTQLVMEPVDFLRRLACLIPPPKRNLIRYLGVFAPHSKLRDALPKPPFEEAVPQGEPPDTLFQGQLSSPLIDEQNKEKKKESRASRTYRLLWSVLLASGYSPSTYCAFPKCGGQRVLVAFIQDHAGDRKNSLPSRPADKTATALPSSQSTPARNGLWAHKSVFNAQRRATLVRVEATSWDSCVF